MASGDERAVSPGDLDGSGLTIGVLRARWNDDIVARLADGVDRALEALGVDTTICRSVPGSFELPFAAKAMAVSGKVDAIVALGVVVRGETTHYELVSQTCARGLQDVQLITGVPIAFGVLTVETREQALARSLGPGEHNVGEEAALVAVEMVRLREAFDPEFDERADDLGRGPYL